MKILYVAHSPGLQGSGLALTNIIISGKNKGIEPVVVFPHEGPLSDRFLEMGVKCYYVMCYNAIFPPRTNIRDCCLYPYRLLRTLATNYLASIRFKRIVSAEEPDLIHTNSGVIRFAAKVANEMGIPHVWHVREFQSRAFFGHPLGGEKRVSTLFHQPNNHCVAITRSVFEHFHLDTGKDCVIYDGVFSRNVELPKILSKKKRFLFVGSLQTGKGIFDALEAFDAIAGDFPEYELWIAGKDYINVEKYIGQCKHPNQVHYIGFRTDIYQLMAESEALLVPSFYEGFGFITAEAMLNRTLVIGRNVAGTKEQFDNGIRICNAPIALAFDDMESFISRLAEVCIKGSSYYGDYIDRAYEVSTELYSVESNIEALSTLYERLISPSHSVMNGKCNKDTKEHNVV